PWWHRSNRDRSSIPDPVHAPVPPPGSALPLPADTVAGSDAPVLLPLTARAECGFPSLHWLPRNCHPPITGLRAPAPLPCTGARSAQTTARTASIPETDRVGSSRTSSDVESPDRS